MEALVQPLKSLGNQIWPKRWHPFVLAEAAIRRASAGRVLSGPFAKMRYVEQSLCSGFTPKLLGTYEQELADLIEEYCAADFRAIIDVGAAEGYYAAGMAFRCPRAHVYAFEMEAEGRALIRRMAELNGFAERITIEGCCTPENLGALLRQQIAGVLLIMDAEGAEKELLWPDLIPQLRTTRILVELHDFVHSGLSEEIARRFQNTHVIRRFDARERSLDDLPIRSRFLDRWLIKHTREFRPPAMSWFDLAPTPC